jgi:hypothetical protein
VTCTIILSLHTMVRFSWLCVCHCSSIHRKKRKLKYVIVFRLQKLALRNSSTTTAQNLRLFIKGQDQDCFQVCTLIFVLSDLNTFLKTILFCLCSRVSLYSQCWPKIHDPTGSHRPAPLHMFWLLFVVFYEYRTLNICRPFVV